MFAAAVAAADAAITKIKGFIWKILQTIMPLKLHKRSRQGSPKRALTQIMRRNKTDKTRSSQKEDIFLEDARKITVTVHKTGR